MRQPQFADKCDKWDEMRPFGGDFFTVKNFFMAAEEAKTGKLSIRLPCIKSDKVTKS